MRLKLESGRADRLKEQRIDSSNRDAGDTTVCTGEKVGPLGFPFSPADLQQVRTSD